MNMVSQRELRPDALTPCRATRSFGLCVGLALLASCGGHAQPTSSAPTARPAADAGPVDSRAADPLALDFEAPLDPAVWSTREDPASIGIDNTVAHSGKASLRVRSSPGTAGFQSVRATFPIERVRGHMVRVDGWARTRDVAGGWAGLWCRVEGPDQVVYDRDNMADRGLTGTTAWTHLTIDMAVPPSATTVLFGGLVAGTGELWIDDLAVEVGASISDEQYRRPTAVDGIVTDADHHPLAGMAVRGVMNTDDRPVVIGTAGVTGADGHFHIELPPGGYTLSATSATTAAGMLAAVQVKNLRPLSGLVLRAGGPAHQLSGRVLDLHGRPVAGALGGARLLQGDDSAAVLVIESDAHGEYRIALPPGHYGLLAVGAGGLPLPPASVKLEGDRRADVTLALRAQLAEPAPAAVRAWLNKAAVPLVSVEAGRGFDDLKPLARTIGNARIVGLGEATHGTREFSQMKHRMLEYLVSELGFSVFMMEAGYAEAIALDDYIVDGKGDARGALGAGVFSIWQTEEVLAMVEWMRAWNADPAHATKLRFYGVDVQQTGAAVAAVLAYLDRIDPEEAARARDYLGRFNQLTDEQYAELPAATRTSLHDRIVALPARFDAQRAAWSKIAGERAWLLARKHADLLRQNEEMRAPPAGENSRDARDKGMAENVAWVLEQAEPGARGVFWAHNGHISRAGYDGLFSVGQRLAARYQQRYVTFGFVWNQGGFRALEYAGSWLHEVGPDAAGGLGATLASLGLPLAAIDLRAAPRGAVRAWLAAFHRTRDIGALYTTEPNMDGVFKLSDCFDAVLFVDRTTAARKL